MPRTTNAKAARKAKAKAAACPQPKKAGKKLAKKPIAPRSPARSRG